ncbi:MAG: peroxide stress protein YaaA, partial [Nocardioidaceae bacterium]
ARGLGLGPARTDVVAANARLRRAATARADRVYTGVLYEALDLPSLSAAARRRASSWLAVTSALFGLLRPGDRIPAYRLSAGTPLPGIGAPSTYWSRRLDAAAREAAGRGLVVDLRSSAYVAFWRPPADLASRTVTVRVLHDRDGHRSVVSHLNKATKGRLVRTLLEHGPGPATPARFADHLTALGWRVERGTVGALDVVVSAL